MFLGLETPYWLIVAFLAGYMVGMFHIAHVAWGKKESDK
jgi:hypothetical protein